MNVEDLPDQAIEAPPAVKNSMGLSDNKKRLHVYCKKCQKDHTIEIDRSIVEDSPFHPVKYSYIHGDPEKIILTLYIDKNFKVRGTEISEFFAMDRSDIDDILSDKSNSLKALQPEQVYGLLFTNEGKTVKEYLDPEWSTDFKLRNLPKIWRVGKVCADDKHDLDEFFLRSSDHWTCGVKFYDFVLYLIVDASVDVDRLTTQAMFVLERLASNL